MKKINKIIIISCICIQTFFSIIGVKAVYNEIVATESNVKIAIDNFDCTWQNKVVNIDGVTYVPLREAFETIGGEVLWNMNSNSISIYTTNSYIASTSDNGIAYHYYKTPITFDKNQMIDCGFKYIESCDKLVFAENPAELINNLDNVYRSDASNLLKQKTDGFWYNVYEDAEKNLWIVYLQYRKGELICDVDELYTIDKLSGKIEKYTSIGSMNLFNYYINQNN